MQSRRLIEMVINDLKLWASYKVEVNHLTENLYKDESPVEFILLHRNPNVKPSQKVTITIENSTNFTLKTSDPENSNPEYSFSSPISTTLGTWQLAPTASLNRFIGKTIVINIDDPKSVVDVYQQNLIVELKDKLESSAVDITLKDQIPQRGQDFINYLITLYNKNEVLEKNRKTKSTLDFIDQRLDSLAIELNSAEKSVEDYRRTHGLTDVTLQSQSYIQSAQANEGRLNEVNIQLKVINDVEAYINAPNVSDKTVPTTLNIGDQNLVALVQSYTDQQRERARMLATTPEMNPAFEPINRQIASTRAAIKENVNNIKSSLQVTRKELLTVGSRFRSSIESLPGEDRELTALRRIQASKESLYNVLLQKREETALSYASTLSSARLVDMAYVLPLKATKALIPFIAAMILGLLIPAGIIYLRDTIKNHVTSRRTIEKLLPTAISGEIEEARLRSQIVTDDINEKMNFTLVEQFRSLRTQLYYLHDTESKGRVTLMASSVAGEGKALLLPIWV
ncbi:GumC family protein [Mucilaginibacter antarcticus]|uniref:GumC family protein n=1 Tax=Mucilaginibacter antarcticus TaxID=1855725 RepID=UPI003641C65D